MEYFYTMKDGQISWTGNHNSLENTGGIDYRECNIYNMAGNVREWTTEYCTGNCDGAPVPVVARRWRNRRFL